MLRDRLKLVLKFLGHDRKPLLLNVIGHRRGEAPSAGDLSKEHVDVGHGFHT